MNQSGSIDESVQGEAVGEKRDDCPLRFADVFGLGGKPLEDPAREDLLESAVEHPRRQPWIEVLAQLAAFLPADDDPLERREGVRDLVDLSCELRASSDFADENAHELRVGL